MTNQTTKQPVVIGTPMLEAGASPCCSEAKGAKANHQPNAGGIFRLVTSADDMFDAGQEAAANLVKNFPAS